MNKRLFKYLGIFFLTSFLFLAPVAVYAQTLPGDTPGEPDDPGKPENAEFDDTVLKEAVCDLFELIEGDMGMHLAVVSGIGALVATVFGAYRASYSFIVVAISAFIIRAMVSLWFVLPDEECGLDKGPLAEMPSRDAGGVPVRGAPPQEFL